ncbi:hypothetical protein HDK64DRAFT_300642 [Phyllosticta capitalensis]
MDSRFPLPTSLEDFKVGWICALALELTAALDMLDENYDKEMRNIPRPPTDYNAYSFGRIGDHYIVIACIQAGSYGTNAASKVGASMVSTFPNVKFGLLVGIGGAIPVLDEWGDTIRLGDVAISQPTNDNGGVFQHDLVKIIDGAPTQNRGFLNKPPGVLLSALEKMKAEHERNDSEVPKILENLSPKMRKPRKGPGYVHQGEKNDRLFKADYKHLDANSDCTECQANREVERQPRESNAPEFHYGIIASGNTLCKDAQLRDEMKKRQKGCICIEMEAAGLMNDFPCLVIRGISDYSDSHKNDQWQRYAAATAAAYAKELLAYVHPDSIVKAESALAIMKSIQSLRNDVKEIQLSTESTERYLTDQALKTWLLPPDHSVNYVEAIKKHHPQTGNWFLCSSEAIRWRRLPNSFLWLHGLPGCGKTVLASALIRDLKQSQIAVVYFFFDFKVENKQNLDMMVRSLVYQLSKNRLTAGQGLQRLFAECRHGLEQPTTARLLEVLVSMIQEFQKVAVVIDAVEEVGYNDRKELMHEIKRIRQLGLQGLHFLVSSRNEWDIKCIFESLGDSVAISGDSVIRDIGKFVHDKIQNADTNGLGKWKTRPDLVTMIQNGLSKTVDGMFRLASLRLEMIEQCSTENELLRSLSDLPQGIHDAYSRVISRIPPFKRERALRLLQFLAFSKRPLSPNQANEMFAVSFDSKLSFDPRNEMLNCQEILSHLPSLVVVDEGRPYEPSFSSPSCHTSHLQLAHFTVQEYLLSKKTEEFFRQGLSEIQANASIVRVSIAFLKGLSLMSPSDAKVQSGFVDHACSWIDNAKYADQDPSARVDVLDFLNNIDHLAFWLSRRKGLKPRTFAVLMNDRRKTPMKSRAHLPTPLYIAIHGHMINLAKTILEYDPSQINDGYEPWVEKVDADESTEPPLGFYVRDQGTSQYRRESALYAAAMQNSEDLVSLLLDHGAAMGKPGGKFGTALSAAMQENHQNSLKVFDSRLQQMKDAERAEALNAESMISTIRRDISRISRGPLLSVDLESRLIRHIDFATRVSKEFSDKTFLQSIVELRDSRTSRSLLHVAAAAGSKRLVEILINSGADINDTDIVGMTPLHCAITEAWILTDLQGGHTPILSARQIRHPNFFSTRSLDVINFLLSNEAEVDWKDKNGMTPLEYAVLRGMVKYADVIIRRKVKIDLGLDLEDTIAQEISAQNISVPNPRRSDSTVPVSTYARLAGHSENTAFNVRGFRRFDGVCYGNLWGG